MARTYIDHFKHRICYGYKRDDQGRAYVDEERAQVVQLIFERYLAGDTPRGIAQYLTDRQIHTPSGKPQWSSTKVNSLLTDLKYVPHIISAQKFNSALHERDRRSNMDLDENMELKRKAARYSSKNVLSGLFVCAECGASYRRIARSSGEVVWRCASRVEHGKVICKSSPTLMEADMITFLCKITGTEALNPEVVRGHIDTIMVGHDAVLTPIYSNQPILSM